MSRDIQIGCLLIIITLSATGALKEDCNRDEDLSQRCLMNLPVLSSPEIPFALTGEELVNSCFELRKGIRCIDNYTNHCMEKHEQVVFRRIYAGITDVVQDLCTRGKYQDEYLKHADCVKKARPEYETCSKNYAVTLMTVAKHQQGDQYQTDQSGLMNSHEDHQRAVCCSIQVYLRCSELTVQRTCGDEAALFASAFLKRMASNIIKSFCLAYNAQECGLSDKSSHISHNVHLISIASLASLALYAYRN